MNEKYSVLAGRKRNYSDRHPQMSRSKRAAQFAPFAALSGFDEAVNETSRVTECFGELCDSGAEELDEKLRLIATGKGVPSAVKITYFKPDMRKSVGAYVTFTGSVGKINMNERKITLSDGTSVPIERLYRIDFL